VVPPKLQQEGVPSQREELLPVEDDGRRLLAWLELEGATDASDLILAIRPITVGLRMDDKGGNASDDGSISIHKMKFRSRAKRYLTIISNRQVWATYSHNVSRKVFLK
jgi:hypothetical protein